MKIVLPIDLSRTVPVAALGLVAMVCATGAAAQSRDAGPAAADSELVQLGIPEPAMAVPATDAPPQDASIPATGQVPVTTLDDVRRELRPGDVISIVRTTGDSMKGRVRRVGETELDIRIESSHAPGRTREYLDLTVPLTEIQWLERHRDPVRNGTLIGAGVGAGIAVALFAHAYAIDRNEMDEWAAGYLVAGGVVAGIGALVGWAVDAVRAKPHLRYDSRGAARPTVSVSPLLSRGAGVAVAVSF